MNILSETLSKKTYISFASGYQLDIASWFGIGTCFHFSLNTGYPWASEDPIHVVTVVLDHERKNKRNLRERKLK